MRGMARLRADKYKFVTLGVKRVLYVLYLFPWQDKVALASVIRAGGGNRNISGLRPEPPSGTGNNYVGQIGCGFDRLAVNDNVLAFANKGVFLAVKFEPSCLVVKRLALLDLLIARNPWIGAEVHQHGTTRLQDLHTVVTFERG